MANPADHFIVPPCEREIEIIHRDEHIIVLNKPHGLLSVPGQDPRNVDSVLTRLKVTDPGVRLVHRLDFATSGLMVACLTDLAIVELNRQFRERLVEKCYEAVLVGHVPEDSFEIDLPIGRGEFPRSVVCFETGKAAVTRVEVVERGVTEAGVAFSKVIFRPVTGRTHQLRLHALSVGFPIMGCDLYSMDVVRAGGVVSSFELSDRLMLHACGLGFTCPVGGVGWFESGVLECGLI